MLVLLSGSKMEHMFRQLACICTACIYVAEMWAGVHFVIYLVYKKGWSLNTGGLFYEVSLYML